MNIVNGSYLNNKTVLQQTFEEEEDSENNGGVILLSIIIVIIMLLLIGTCYMLSKMFFSEEVSDSHSQSDPRRTPPASDRRLVKEEPLFIQKVSSIDSDCYFVIRGVHPEEQGITVRRVGTDPMYHVTEPKQNKIDEVFTKDTIEKSQQLKTKRKYQGQPEMKIKSCVIPAKKTNVKNSLSKASK